jgi:hypothetical protein
MTDPQRVTAHFGEDLGGVSWPGSITAMEGRGGVLRVALTPPPEGPQPGTGSECVLEMHDGARFRFVVTEQLPESAEYRMKLLGRGQSPEAGAAQATATTEPKR